MKQRLIPRAALCPGLNPSSVSILAILLAGCESTAHWSNSDALASRSVEVEIDAGGKPMGVEYFVGPETVPAAIYDAMNALYKGGQTVAAQKESVGSSQRWVIIKRLDSREIEAAFTPDGKLQSERVEVFSVNVPDAVKKAARVQLSGEVTRWQEVRDGERRLVEYHAHVTSRSMNYKMRISTAGRVLGVTRKVPAEIEIPVQ
jgi:hypothetical protein